MIDVNKYKFGSDFDVKLAIKGARVTHDEIIPSAETLLWFKDSSGKMISIFTRANISAIIGKAKSRKTFCNTILSAALIIGEFCNKIFASIKKPLKVVYFDTEQGRGRAQKVLKRIIALSGNINQIDMISMRPYATIERVEIIDEYLKTHKPDVAFIDGIRDLIMDFNNLSQSTELMTSLLRWSETHDCHICCVLHMNKADGNARGHLGSELMNKAESVIAIDMIEGSQYSDIKSVYMRDGDFESFQFTISDGLPVICGYEETVKGKLYNPDAFIETKKDEILPF
jgi:RecA-family ATPase